MPNLENCSHVWSPASIEDIVKIEKKMQSASTRFVFHRINCGSAFDSLPNYGERLKIFWCELWNPVTFSQIYSFDSAFFRSNWNYMQANTTSSGHLREMVGSTYVTLEFDRKEEGGPYPTTSNWLWHRQGILEPLEQIIYQLSKNKHLIASDSSKMKSW